MFDSLAPYLAYWSSGALLTVLLTSIAFPVATSIGVIVALAQISGSRIASRMARLYMAVFRGLPEVLVIFVVFFGSSLALQRLQAVTGMNLPKVNPVPAALLALSIQFGAYAAVIFSDWLKVFPKGLVEAGAAVGMTRNQIRRRIYVPILLAQATPALGNLVLVMIKISALASLIGVEELSRRTTIVAGSTRDPLLCYSVAAAMYLAITAVATLFQARIETRTRGKA